ncbi:hypothetical protein [Dickeya zeae]|nr:hypothetical protein [Dickeya zeae]
MKQTHETQISTTQSVDLIASIVGRKLDITGEKTGVWQSQGLCLK